MPLTKKGKKIMKSMKSQYGEKKGKQVFYASANKGVIKGVHGSGPFSAAEMERGFKVLCTASKLHEMDPERMHNLEEHVLANRRNGNSKQMNLHRLEKY